MPAQTIKQVKKTPQATNGNRTLADILLTQGALPESRVERVKMAEIQSGKSQEDILTDQKMVNEEQLIKAKAELYNIPFVNLAMLPSDPEALAILPQEVAERFNVFPIGVDKNTQTLS
ncbi:hypothetical protein ACFL0F_02475 [Patescibacteria group bacterium]